MSIQTKHHGYLSNSAWLLASNLIASVLGLLVFSVIARTLGPVEYGYFAYVFSIAALFAILGQMGLDGLMVREIVEAKDRARQAVVMGTAGALRLAGYAFGALICLGFGLFMPAQTTTETWLFVTAFFFILLTPLPLIPNAWLQAQSEARFGAMAGLTGNVVGSCFKIGLVLAGFGVIWVGAVQAGTVLLVLCIILPIYVWRGGPPILTLRFDWAVAKGMLRESWQIFAGSILAIIYLKIDLVMLRWMSGPEEVGIYAVAARLSEVPYILAATIVTTIFPRLIELYKAGGPVYAARLQTVFHVMATLAFVLMGCVALLGPTVIRFAFGPEFTAAGPMLLVHMLAMPFIYMRYVFSRWIIMERFAVFSIYSQGAGALANVALNLLLIPTYGGIGAAIATVVSYACAAYFCLLLSPRTRPIFKMMTRALFMPWKAMTELHHLRAERSL
jgi:O-antigen/teichoic acid export membrane protein